MVRVFRSSRPATCIEDLPQVYQDALNEYKTADPIPNIKALALKHQVYQGSLNNYIKKFNLLRADMREVVNAERAVAKAEKIKANKHDTSKAITCLEDLPEKYQIGIKAYLGATITPAISRLCADYGLWSATLNKYIDVLNLRREPYVRNRNLPSKKIAGRRDAAKRLKAVTEAPPENSKLSLELPIEEQGFTNQHQSEEKKLTALRLVAKACQYEADPDGVEPKLELDHKSCAWVILLSADNKEGIDETGKWKGETLWCGREKLVDSAYCKMHHRRAYRAAAPYQKPVFPDKTKAKQI